MDENMTASTRHPVRKLSTWAFNLKAYSANVSTTKAVTEIPLGSQSLMPIGLRSKHVLARILTLLILIHTVGKLEGYQIFETPYPPVSNHKKLRSIAHQIPTIAIPNEQGTMTIFR